MSEWANEWTASHPKVGTFLNDATGRKASMFEGWFLLLATQAINSWARQGTAWKLQTQLWVQSAGFLGLGNTKWTQSSGLPSCFQVKESRILGSVITLLEAYMFNPRPKITT